MEAKIKASTATINSNWTAGGVKVTNGGTGTRLMLKDGAGTEGSEITTVPYWTDVTTELKKQAKLTVAAHKLFITELAKK